MPTKEDYAVAQFLHSNVQTRQAKLHNNDVRCFVGELFCVISVDRCLAFLEIILVFYAMVSSLLYHYPAIFRRSGACIDFILLCCSLGTQGLFFSRHTGPVFLYGMPVIIN